jgi:hypothetical protein
VCAGSYCGMSRYQISQRREPGLWQPLALYFSAARSFPAIQADAWRPRRLIYGGQEQSLVDFGGLIDSGDLSDELQGSSSNLLRSNRWIEIKQSFDIPAHAPCLAFKNSCASLSRPKCFGTLGWTIEVPYQILLQAVPRRRYLLSETFHFRIA